MSVVALSGVLAPNIVHTRIICDNDKLDDELFDDEPPQNYLLSFKLS